MRYRWRRSSGWHLRERIGESLKSLRADPPLERITTGSLEALQLYTQATRFGFRGDPDRSLALLEQTVALDSSFAMAWRRLGTAYAGRPDFQSRQRARDALTRAFLLRDRVSDRERLHIEGFYASGVERDWDKAVTAYLALLERHPDDPAALHNIAGMYANLGRWADRDQTLWRAIRQGVAEPPSYVSLILWSLLKGVPKDADSVLALLLLKTPDHVQSPQLASDIAFARRDFASAQTEARKLIPGGPLQRQAALFRLASLEEIHGRLSEAKRLRSDAIRIAAERLGQSPDEARLAVETAEAEVDLWFRDVDRQQVAEGLEALWRRNLAVVEKRPTLAQGYPRFIGTSPG